MGCQLFSTCINNFLMEHSALNTSRCPSYYIRQRCESYIHLRGTGHVALFQRRPPTFYNPKQLSLCNPKSIKTVHHPPIIRFYRHIDPFLNQPSRTLISIARQKSRCPSVFPTNQPQIILWIEIFLRATPSPILRIMC